jgi:uncharacterized membrane protein
MIAAAESWSGPLPPPSALQQYENAIPGSAERMLVMAERQEEHRINIEKTQVTGELRRSYWGLAAGFVLSALVIGGGIFLVATGHDWAGATMIGLNLVGLASVFVYGSRMRHREEEQQDTSVASG